MFLNFWILFQLTIQHLKFKRKHFCLKVESADLLVKYSQWQGASSELSKISVSETVESAFSELKRQLPAYLIHVYIKRKQKTFFEKKKSNVDGKSCVLHVDFSENALLRDQDEPQSAHWTHNQAGLFTASF